MDTLIILDWDDTILPSTWLTINKLRFEDIIYSHYIDELGFYQTDCINLLNEMMKYAHLIIITNAEKGWVENSCQQFLPKLFPIISKLKIISSRTEYMKVSNDPFIWKELAFRAEIELYITQNPNILQNIISIGDSLYERMAILNSTNDLKGLAPINYIKSVKLSERPELLLLIQQIEKLTNSIKKIIDEKSSLDLMLMPPPINSVNKDALYDPE